MKLNRNSNLVLPCLLAVWGCAHGTRPQDMTAEQHRAVAQQEDREAHKEAAAAYSGAPGASALNAGINPELYLYPQGSDLGQNEWSDAQRLELRAREHEQAAADLERSEDAECKTVPTPQRTTCPLLGSVNEIRDIDGGERVRFNDPARASALLPQMRCHYAYARAHGFSDSPQCALYMQGLDFRQDVDPHAIDIVVVGGGAKATAELRRRVAMATGRAP